MIDIIIFALIAFFIGRKLYKSLGDTKHDNELSEENKQAYKQFRDTLLKDAEESAGDGTQIEIASALEAEMSEDERRVFEDIRTYIPDFTADKFVHGAKNAFETILDAYSKQRKDVLEKLVSKELLDKFLHDIERLQANAQTQNITVVGVGDIKILSTIRQDSQAIIKVRFESEQISNLTDNISGELISGSLSRLTKCIDTWTFAKKINTKSNIWTLISNED